MPRHTAVLHSQETLDLGQFSISLLERRGTPHEDVEPEVITDGHLVCEPAQIPMQLGDLFGEGVAATTKLGTLAPERRRSRGWGTVGGCGRPGGPVDVLTHRSHRYPVDTTSGSALDFSS